MSDSLIDAILRGDFDKPYQRERKKMLTGVKNAYEAPPQEPGTAVLSPGTTPEDFMPAVEVDPIHVYANSEEFQGIVREAQHNGMDALPPNRRKQLEKAIEVGIIEPEVVQGPESNAEEQGGGLLPPHVQGAFDAVRGMYNAYVSKGAATQAAADEWVSSAIRGIKRLDKRISEGQEEARPYSSWLPDKPLSEILQDGWRELSELTDGAIELQPLEKGATEPAVVYDEEGKTLKVEEREVPEAQRIARNFFTGAIRFAPELLTGLLDNPYEFAKGLATFPLDQANLIMEAAGLDIQAGGPIPFVAADPEAVKQAREELALHPFGVALLGMLAVHGTARLNRASKYRSVKPESIDEMGRDLGEATKRAEAAERDATQQKRANQAERRKQLIEEDQIDVVREQVQKTTRTQLIQEVMKLKPELKPGEVAALDKSILEAIVLNERLPEVQAAIKQAKKLAKEEIRSVDETGKQEAKPDAVQKPSPETVDVRKPASDGKKVGEKDAKGQKAPEKKTPPQEEIKPPAKAEIVETGNEMADVTRNLAHTKREFKANEEFLKREDIPTDLRSEIEARQKTLGKEVDKYQAEVDRLRQAPAQAEGQVAPVEQQPGSVFESSTRAPEKPKSSNKSITFAERGEVSYKKIETDPSRFQNRDEPFSQQSYERLETEFHGGKMDDIVIWRDPKTGKDYALTHTRYEFLKDKGNEGLLSGDGESIPYRRFEGTEAEAIEYALTESNRGGTAENIGGDIRAYQIKKEALEKKKLSKTEREKRLKVWFGGDRVGKLDAYTNLNPKGKFVDMLTQPEGARGSIPYLEQKARDVGEIRRDFKELTDVHERQMFDAMYGENAMWKVPKEDFRAMVEKQITDAMWDKSQPLRFKKGDIPTTGARARKDTGPAMRRIDELRELRKKVKTVEEVERIDKEIADLQKHIDRAVEQQTDLLNFEAIEPQIKKGGGLGLMMPDLSLQAQFAKQLRAAERQRKSADVPGFKVGRPKDIGLFSWLFRTRSNLFGIIPGQKANYGVAAQKAVRDLVLTDFKTIIESGLRAEKLDNVIRPVPRKDWGKKGERLYDHVVDPSRDAELSPQGKKAVEVIREQMEADRREIIKRKREAIRPSVERLVNKEWRAENELTGKKLTEEQRAELNRAVDKAVAERVPDDWGVENYLPQMHPGSWEVYAEIGDVPQFVGAARTPSEALTKAMEHYGNHPELSPDAYTVTGRAFKGGDPTVRISDRKYWNTINSLSRAADATLSKEQIKGFLQGSVGRKAGKQKYASFLQERTGYEGFRKDLRGVLGAYNRNFVRWKNLNDINSRIQPLLDQMRAEGRKNTALEVESILTHLWGHAQTKASSLIDAGIQNIPGLRDHVAPMLYERILGRTKGGVVLLYLKSNPRFHLLNSLQRAQTLWPDLKGGEWKKGTDFYKSPEGKAALEYFGIKHITGGKLLEGTSPITSPKVRERLAKARLAPETRNQEIAWATMYKRAKDMGYSDLAANDYALLKGNLHSQFVHVTTDIPAILRGPTLSTIFQFKRFPIKNLEMGMEFIAKKNYPGVAKWLGTQVVFGGAKMMTKPVVAATGASWIAWEAYQEIKDELGEEVANAVAFGLPSFIGLDMSYSFQLIDTPWGETVQEKIGNTFLGPAGQTAVGIGTAATSTKGPETSRLKRIGRETAQRVPAFRSLLALEAVGNKLNEGEYIFRDPAGRQKFKGDLTDVIVKGLGGRTTKEAKVQLLVESITHVAAQRDEVLDQLANRLAETMHKGGTLTFDEMQEWNELWPEFPIGASDVVRRAKSRYELYDKTRIERTFDNLPSVFRKAMKDFE